MTGRFLLALAFCTIAFSAFAEDEVDVPAPSHDVPRGTLLRESDLAYKSIPAMRANDSIVRGMADALGMETRRALRSGELIRGSDLKRPTVVAKGSTVTMIFEAPGMTLTFAGRAMAEGGEGDTVAVLNPASFRQVQGIVVAPGMVRVGSAAAPASKIATAD